MITIDGNSCDGADIKTRSIGLPETNMITATVPYMSGYYNFSAIYDGVPSYSGRELVYTIDILEESETEAEATKNRILQWAMHAVESRLEDDADPEYYFVASYESAEYAENDELPELGGELTLTFLAQPYRYKRTDNTKVIP